MHQNIKNRLLALAVAMDNPSLSDSIPLLSSTLQSLASSCSAHFGLSSAVDAISQLQQQITRLTNINYSSTETALRTLAQTPDYLLNTVSLSSSTACQNLCDSLSIALERAGPHLPQDEKERCETIIKSQVAEKPCLHLTLSDALSILSILLSILFLCLNPCRTIRPRGSFSSRARLSLTRRLRSPNSTRRIRCYWMLWIPCLAASTC